MSGWAAVTFEAKSGSFTARRVVASLAGEALLPPPYTRAMKSRGVAPPFCAQSATSPAIRGATALVPPKIIDFPST